MTIKLNELARFRDRYMEENRFYDFCADIEEDSEDYTELLEEIMLDMKHLVSDWLRNAIENHFDREVLTIDYGISSDIADILLKYENNEIEITF